LENRSKRGRERLAAALRFEELDLIDAVLDAMVDDDAPAGGDDVAIPVNVVAIGQFSDESRTSVRRGG
jgi:hypothetical protein